MVMSIRAALNGDNLGSSPLAKVNKSRNLGAYMSKIYGGARSNTLQSIGGRGLPSIMSIMRLRSPIGSEDPSSNVVMS